MTDDLSESKEEKRERTWEKKVQKAVKKRSDRHNFENTEEAQSRRKVAFKERADKRAKQKK